MFQSCNESEKWCMNEKVFEYLRNDKFSFLNRRSG